MSHRLVELILALVLPQHAAKFRPDHSRRDQVDADALVGQLHGHVLAQAQEGCLADRVGADRGHARVGRNGGDVDDGAFVAGLVVLEHVRHNLLAEQKWGLDIDLKYLVPMRLLHVHEGAEVWVDGNIRDEDVDGAEFVQGEVDQFLLILLIAHMTYSSSHMVGIFGL